MANPNPSPETRFKPGQSGNPGGKSGEQLRIDREAADMAAKIRHKILSSLAGKIDAGEDPLQFVDPAMLKLFKDSEDRAHGTPRQAVDHTTNGKDMPPPSAFVIEGVAPEGDD